ncbi:hypothetical protein INR49_006234 [Caranx melampygus]|nr:hypothetical protein INR49_006234 [Caranx melampygus]
MQSQITIRIIYSPVGAAETLRQVTDLQDLTRRWNLRDNRVEREPPSLSPDCLTRFSIADTQLCHPEQSPFSDRKASRLTAPQRLERGELVGEAVGRWIFYLLKQRSSKYQSAPSFIKILTNGVRDSSQVQPKQMIVARKKETSCSKVET